MLIVIRFVFSFFYKPFYEPFFSSFIRAPWETTGITAMNFSMHWTRLDTFLTRNREQNQNQWNKITSKNALYSLHRDISVLLICGTCFKEKPYLEKKKGGMLYFLKRGWRQNHTIEEKCWLRFKKPWDKHPSVITFCGTVYTFLVSVQVIDYIQFAHRVSCVNSFPFSSLVSLFELKWYCHFKLHCTVKKSARWPASGVTQLIFSILKLNTI